MAQNPRLRMVSEAIWKTIVLAYQDPEDRADSSRVALPMMEVCNALTTCLANVVAQMDDAGERQKVMRNVGPAIDRVVRQSRGRADLMGGNLPILLPPDDGIILPD